MAQLPKLHGLRWQIPSCLFALVINGFSVASIDLWQGLYHNDAHSIIILIKI